MCFFICLLLRSVCGTGNSSQQTSLQCLSTINMVFSEEDKILIQTHNTRSKHSYTLRGIKIGALKILFVCMFTYLLNICRKFEFLIFQGSVATCLRWGESCCVIFVANFTSFPAVQKIEYQLRFDRVRESLKVGTFYETQWRMFHVDLYCEQCI